MGRCRQFGLAASVLLLEGIVSGRAGAQVQDSAYPLFAEDTPLTLRLSAPFQALTRNEDRTEYEAVVELPDEAGQVAFDIDIRVRGRSRLANCDFPPLSLDFPREAVGDTVFAGQRRLKLVTVCKSSDNYRDYLALEYLVYRFFNRLTDRSFRVRWVDVEYVYTDSRRPKSLVEHAFLIEDDREVAERLGLQVIERQQIDVADLDPEHTALATLFHFMIGNTDWSVIEADADEPCCHNGKVVGEVDGPFIVVPYDFDQSGLINTEYAVPSDALPIRFVTQRYYRGFCRLNPQIEAAVARINTLRGQFGSGVDESMLRARSLERAIEYLDRSYEIVNDARRLQGQVYERCRV